MNHNINNFGSGYTQFDNQIETVKFRYKTTRHELVEHFQSEPFLKGPIPISWLNQVSSLPGKTLHVALAIRWLSDMNNGKPIKLTRKALQLFSVSTDAALDAIKRMENAGLIKVQRLPGQRAIIEIVSIEKNGVK